jgi:hypothetical protein
MMNVNYRMLFVLMLILILMDSCANDADDINTEVIDTTINVSDATTALITEWNTLWLELDRYTSGMRPNATARALAYIHLAAYETGLVNMADYTSNTGRLQDLNINPNELQGTINLNIALNACYASSYNHFMYNLQSGVGNKIDLLKVSKEDELSEGIDNTVVQNSIHWGNYVAERVIAYSITDTEGESQILDPQPYAYEPQTGDGFWTYSADAERAWFPYWSTVRTFVISSEETSSIPPSISYSEDINSDYYAEMNEVYTISNAAKEEDNEGLWIAEFWSDDVEGLMMSPPGRQISIALQLIVQNDLDYEDSLVLLLKLGFSLNDAAVSTWADKYEYMVMRPSVYIQEFIDTEFQTNLYRFINWPNPSFPGYPSGHSTFSSAAAGIFINEFGNIIDFTDRSHEGRTEFRGLPRQFNSFTEMAEESAFSRVPFGVHIRMDCTEGIRLGYEISDAINSLDLTTN